jgi:hypothetical protein
MAAQVHFGCKMQEAGERGWADAEKLGGKGWAGAGGSAAGRKGTCGDTGREPNTYS